MCIFCEIANGNIPSYKVYEDEICVAFLDISQATIGHTLVVPKKHYNDIFDLDEDVTKHLFFVVNLIAKNMKEKLNINDLNILNNSGELAGQTVKHFHIHIIPRYKDDNLKIEFSDNKLSKDDFISLAKKISIQ